jgi:hypothetical protein
MRIEHLLFGYCALDMKYDQSRDPHSRVTDERD